MTDHAVVIAEEVLIAVYGTDYGIHSPTWNGPTDMWPGWEIKRSWDSPTR